MTIRELSQLRWLNQEIERNKRRLAELDAAAKDTSSKITGIPHAQGISDKTAIAAEIADMRTILQAQMVAAVKEYSKLNRYIAGVDDSLVRQILSLRYIEGLTWREVAENMGPNTEGSIKMAVLRYLQKH